MAVVYASAHLSLAVLEILVNVERSDLPDNLIAYEIDCPDSSVGVLEPRALEDGWQAEVRTTRRLGDAWARERATIALEVPSAVIPLERNYLLNPEHPDADRLRVVSEQPFSFDPRLRG